MRKVSKRLCALFLSTALLSGCSQFPSLDDWLLNNGSFQDPYQPVSSEEQNSDQSAESVPLPTPKEDPLEPLRHITVSLVNDFQNERTLTIDGQNLTVTVKDGDWETDSIKIGTEYFRSEKSGNTTTYTFNGEGLRIGYVNVEFWGGGYVIKYRLKHDENGYSFPSVLGISENNKQSVDSPRELSYEETLKYITKDGTSKNAAAVMNKIKRLSEQICRGKRTDYDKLRAISQWVSDNIYYDYKAYKAGIPDECITLEYMLERGASVCGGYAAMTSALCEAQGIKCLHIHGTALNHDNCFAETDSGARHEWNYAIIGNRGIWIDSGWNSHSSFYDVGNYKHADISYRYFDPGTETFALDHYVSYAQKRNYFPD